MRRSGLLLFCAAVLAGCAESTVEEPELCIDTPWLTIPAGTATGTFEAQFTVNVASHVPLVDLGAPTTELRLTRLAVSAGSSEAGAELIRSARLTLLPPPGSPLPAYVLLDGSQGGASGSGTALVYEGGDFEVVPYLYGGALTADVYVSGQLPPEPVATAVEACFQLKGKL